MTPAPADSPPARVRRDEARARRGGACRPRPASRLRDLAIPTRPTPPEVPTGLRHGHTWEGHPALVFTSTRTPGARLRPRSAAGSSSSGSASRRPPRGRLSRPRTGGRTPRAAADAGPGELEGPMYAGGAARTTIAALKGVSRRRTTRRRSAISRRVSRSIRGASSCSPRRRPAALRRLPGRGRPLPAVPRHQAAAGPDRRRRRSRSPAARRRWPKKPEVVIVDAAAPARAPKPPPPRLDARSLGRSG